MTFLIELEQKKLSIYMETQKTPNSQNILRKKNEDHGTSPITSWQIDGETVETVPALFWGAPKSLQMLTAALKLKDTCSLEGKLWQT